MPKAIYVDETGSDDKKPARILITRLRYLGDVILTTPVVSALKDRYPSAEIYYLAEYPYSEVMLNNPNLEGVLSLKKGLRETLKMVKELRSISFDAAVDLFYNPRSAWLVFMAGIPVREGGTRRIRKYLYTHNCSVPREVKSALAHHLYFLRMFGVKKGDDHPRIYLTDEEKRGGIKILQSMGLKDDNRLLLAMHPGGTWQAKRWPVENFIKLTSLVKNRLNARIVLVHGPGEKNIGESISRSGGAGIKLLPLQSIRSLASVLCHCDGVVSNDGGVMHMSAALQRPTVGIMGPTDPEVWFPYINNGPYRVVTRNKDCSPCNKHYCDHLSCLREITPEDVYRNIDMVLRNRSM
jgi:lipopolysaccharide heptosyltransferase II